MSRWKSNLLVALVCLTAASATVADAQVTILIKSDQKETKAPFEGDRAAVDVALLLDTSNSMDGLISQAKNQLWTIVQEFSRAKRAGKTPRLRVALFEYGNTRLPASEGYIRQVVQLTDDLDELSEALFSLRTNGGDEYCGQVIDEALTRLDWTERPNSYKAIFIAGNEPFTQGDVPYEKACRRAIESGVVVNTIHCGDYQTGIRGQWKDGADLAEGEYFNIDQDQKQVHIDCPQDTIILRLNAELNKTYLWYGQAKQRQRWAHNQVAQDVNAEGLSAGAAVSRVAAKCSDAYNNSARDLVDGCQHDKELLTRVADEELPEMLREMKPGDRKKYIDDMAAKRKSLQEQIAKLNVERDTFAQQKRAEMAEDGEDNSLGAAIVNAVRKQLANAGFENVE